METAEGAPASKKVKLTKRERKRTDPLLHLNIEYLLDNAKAQVLAARTPAKPNLRFNWQGIRQSQKFIKEIRAMASKAVYRLPKSVKHQFCKNCNVYLLPTVTCANKIVTEDGYKFLRISCLLCRNIKKLVIKKGVKKRKLTKIKLSTNKIPEKRVNLGTNEDLEMT